MAKETKHRAESDGYLQGYAHAHDGVATQRDLRETERYLADRFDDKIDKLNAKMDRMVWLIISSVLGIAVSTLIAIIVQV